MYKELTLDRTIAKFSAAQGGRYCSVTHCGGQSPTGKGWMESPLHGQLLNPKALAQCPRGVLQASSERGLLQVGGPEDFHTPVRVGVEAVDNLRVWNNIDIIFYRAKVLLLLGHNAPTEQALAHLPASLL